MIVAVFIRACDFHESFFRVRHDEVFGVTTNANDPSVKVAYFNMAGWGFIRLAFYWL